MNDIFTPYETGLAQLLERLGSDHPRYTDALVYQHRLQKNIAQARQYGDTEALQHEQAQIVDRLNRLALEAVGVSFNELCELRHQEGVRSYQEMTFVNREDELRLLQVERLRASRSPYTLINAPAGYGKSYLLQHLIYTIESNETIRQKWCIRYVDFCLETGDQVADIVHSISGATLQDKADVIPDVVCSYVVQELSAPLPDERRAVLLVFDGVERLEKDACQWLYTLLHNLRRQTRVGYQEIVTVRVIVAGRNAESFWEGYERAYPKPPAPQRVSLSPFDEHSIQELIWSQARATRIGLDDQTVIQIANEVQYLGSGHPKVTRSLVDDLAGRSFAIGPVSEYFDQNRERLVQAILSPVADDLLESIEADVDTSTREATRTLSVFRRVNANTVQALIEAGVLPPETDEIDLLGDMQRAHLLDGPGIREPFYRDRLMRRIWALDMAYRSREGQARYRQLNKVALDLYRNWIHNLGQGLPDTPLKATQRLLSVVEWLFHALQDEDLDKDALHSGLQEHIGALSKDGQLLSVADLIADEIRKDAEVCYSLRHRLGDDGIAVVCSWLKHS